MNLLEIWATWGNTILLVLFVLVGVGITVVRGQGKALAELALNFVLQQAQAGVDSVSQSEVNQVVATLYLAAPGYVGPIPWKVFISAEQCQKWAWDAWNRLHALLDSADAYAAARALDRARGL